MNTVSSKIYTTDKKNAGLNIRTDAIKTLGINVMVVVIGEVLYKSAIGDQIIILLYLLAVQVISASTSAYVYGILSAFFCTFAFDFLITDPRMGFSFTIGLPITLFIMLLATVITSTITTRIKSKALIAFKKELHMQQLYEINQKLLTACNMDTIIDLTREYLMSHLQRQAVLYTSDPYGPNPGPCEESGAQATALYTDEQKKQVHQIFQTGAVYPSKDSYDVFNVPAISKGTVLGVIGIACNGTPLNQGELPFIWMMAGQVTLALERQYLSDEQARILVEAEKEKTRSTLLRSISHDLRTPLTGILGASSTVLEQKDLDSTIVKNHISDIKQHAQWLIRVVENILMITRISGAKIKKEPIAAEEVVSEAVSIVRKNFFKHTFRVHIPDELLLVPMDGALVSQVLINLLENASKNSPEGSMILVELVKKDGYAEFDITDSGSGIPGHLMGNLFEVQDSRREQDVDVSRSTGLGLSICKTIVRAHGGIIEGHNCGKQGAKFSFRLPLQEEAKADE